MPLLEKWHHFPSDEAAEQCVAADEAGASDGASQLNAVFARLRGPTGERT